MLYKQFLLGRKAIGIYLILVLLIGLAAGAALLNVKTAAAQPPLRQNLLFTLAWFAAIFAAITGSNIGSEAALTARSTLLLPRPRWRVACELLLVDFTILVVGLIGSIVAFYAPGYILGAGRFGLDPNLGAEDLALPIVFIFSIYALSAAFSLVFRRLPHASAAVPATSVVLFLLSSGQWSVAMVFRVINIVNPFAYYIPATNLIGNPNVSYPSVLLHLGITGDVVALILLSVIGVGAALFQWQRLEIS